MDRSCGDPKYLVDAHHRAGRITRTARDVALALLRRLGTDGRLLTRPSNTLAADVACGERTAGRSTMALRGVGLIRWTCRIVRNGWRCEQTSNQYEILPSAVPPVPACDRHPGRETRKIDISYCPQVSEAQVAAAQAALAQRRAVIEGRLLGKGMAAPAGAR